MEVGSSPRSQYFDADAPQTLPPQALLIRRMEGLLFAVLGELRAGADWGTLALEYIAGEPPSTPLGRPRRPTSALAQRDGSARRGVVFAASPTPSR